MYTIDTTTGALTPKGEIGGSGTFGGIYGEGNTVVVDPSGRFAYVGQNELVNTTVSGGVSMNSIEATTGKLRSIETVDAAGDVLSLAVHPSGNFAYATADAFLSPRVSVYTLNAATGVLASNGTAPTEQYVVAGMGPGGSAKCLGHASRYPPLFSNRKNLGNVRALTFTTQLGTNTVESQEVRRDFTQRHGRRDCPDSWVGIPVRPCSGPLPVR